MSKLSVARSFFHKTQLHDAGYRILPVSYARKASSVAAAAEDNAFEDPRLANAKPFSEMPSLPMLPFIGSAWVYFPVIGRYSVKKMHIAGRQKNEKYGDVFREGIGKFNIVMSFRPEDMESMLRQEGKYPSRGEFSTLKAYRESRKQWYNSTGIMILQGKEWHDLRSKAQPHLMKPKVVHAYLDPMQEVAEDLLKRVRHLRDSKNEVDDFLPELYKWALESVAVVGLDTRLGCLDNNLPPESDGQRMITAVQTMFECMSQLEAFAGNIQFWKYFPTPKWRQFCKAGDVFSEISHKHITRALESLKENTEDKELTLLQSMLATKDFDVPRAMVTVADMLMAGIDTTSHAIGFLLYHLARNPDKQDLLYKEVSSILPSKNQRINTSAFNELRYLKACLKESMRVDPVVGGIARTMDHDVVVGGYRVPAGSTIAVGFQEICRKEKYFKDASKFIPERWLDKENKPHPFAYLPFGFGPRSCIGRRIAELEMICLIAQIVKAFKIEYHYEDVGMNTRLINTPDRPLRFTFLDR